jgi:hypothetical protein
LLVLLFNSTALTETKGTKIASHRLLNDKPYTLLSHISEHVKVIFFKMQINRVSNFLAVTEVAECGPSKRLSLTALEVGRL